MSMSCLKFRRRTAAVLVAAALWPAAHLGAQEPTRAATAPKRLALTAFLGAYGSPGDLVSDSTLQLRQAGALAAGLRAGWSLAENWTLQAGVSWTPSMIAETDWQRTKDLGGGVVLASGRLLANIDALSGPQLGVFVAPGIGLIHRYGDAWEGMRGTSEVALVLGAGADLRVAGLPIEWSLEAEVFGTRPSYIDYANQRRSSGLHADFVFAVGATLSRPWR